MDQLTAWLAESDQGPAWNRYLLTDLLKAQLAAGDKADPIAVAKVLSRYRGELPGLERRRFVETREALAQWAGGAAPGFRRADSRRHQGGQIGFFPPDG